MAVLSGVLGYRPDGPNNTPEAATPLGADGKTSGLIRTTADRDYYRFDHGGGPMRVAVTMPPDWIGNLVPKLSLIDAAGRVLVSVAADVSQLQSWVMGTPAVLANVALDLTLPAGSYTAAVGSDGKYGSVGTYTLNVTTETTSPIPTPTPPIPTPTPVPTPPPPVPPPASVVLASATPTAVDLRWAPPAGAASYVVERSVDGVNWAVLAKGGPIGTAGYRDVKVSPDVTYFYRLTATLAVGTASVSTPPVLPGPSPAGPLDVTGLAATAGPGRVDLSWATDARALRYSVWRSPDSRNFAQISPDLPPGTASFRDIGVASGVTYIYQVQVMSATASAARAVSVTT